MDHSNTIAQAKNLMYFRMQLLQAEIEMNAMVAANKQCEFNGDNLLYTEEDFTKLIEKHSIHHNAFPFIL